MSLKRISAFCLSQGLREKEPPLSPIDSKWLFPVWQTVCALLSLCDLSNCIHVSPSYVSLYISYLSLMHSLVMMVCAEPQVLCCLDVWELTAHSVQYMCTSSCDGDFECSLVKITNCRDQYHYYDHLVLISILGSASGVGKHWLCKTIFLPSVLFNHSDFRLLLPLMVIWL